MTSSDLHSPVLSVALNRGTPAGEQNSSYDPNLGFLGFGGQVPVPVTNTTAVVPIQAFVVGTGASKKTEHLFYSVDIDSLEFTGSSNMSTKGGAILDTGTVFTYLPTPVCQLLDCPALVSLLTYNRSSR